MTNPTPNPKTVAACELQAQLKRNYRLMAECLDAFRASHKPQDNRCIYAQPLNAAPERAGWQSWYDWHEDHGHNLVWVMPDFNETHEMYFGGPLDFNWPFEATEEPALRWCKLPALPQPPAEGC
jgi:hypothetical protein